MKNLGTFKWSGEVEPAPPEKRQIFLSHASEDKESYVYPFAAKLKQAGITYWLDDAEIKWGEQIAGKINNGLAISEYVVVFLSKAFVGRNWTESELFAALSLENEAGRLVVLPIIIGDSKEILSDYPLLKSKKYKKWDDGIDLLVAEIFREISPADKSILGFDPKPIENVCEKIGKITKKDKIELVENDQGKLCLLHDRKLGPTFGTIPFFAAYHVDTKVFEIIFNTGYSMTINFTLSGQIHQSLLKQKKILIVRMNGEIAAEGFELLLMLCKNGKIIDAPGSAKKGRFPFLNYIKSIFGIR